MLHTLLSLRRFIMPKSKPLNSTSTTTSGDAFIAEEAFSTVIRFLVGGAAHA